MSELAELLHRAASAAELHAAKGGSAPPAR